jgi:hypothetical protein
MMVLVVLPPLSCTRLDKEFGLTNEGVNFIECLGEMYDDIDGCTKEWAQLDPGVDRMRSKERTFIRLEDGEVKDCLDGIDARFAM